MPRPFAVIGFSFAFVLGVLFSAPEQALVIFAVLSVALFGLSVLIKKKPEPVIVFAALAALAACVVYSAFMYGEYYPTVELAGKDLAIEARVTDNPREQNGRYYYTLKLVGLNGEAKKAKLVLSAEAPLEAEAGDRLSFKGEVYVRGGEDDEMADYYRSTGVYLGASATSEIRVTAARRRSLSCYPALFRRAVCRNIMAAIPGDRGGLIVSMLFGDTSQLSDGVKKTFRNVGLSHLFSVSGLHISIWAVAVTELLKRVGLRGKAAYAASMFFALLFMAVTGYSYSCVRAGIMIIIMLTGRFLMAPYDSYNALGAAVLVSAVIRPFSVSSVSLQLSALSTLGIIFITEKTSDFNRAVFSRIKGRLIRTAVVFFVSTVEVAAASAIFTLPVTSAYFGKAVLVSPISNIVMLSISSRVMILGGIAGLLSCIKFAPFLSVPPAAVMKFLTGLSLRLINWLDGYKNLFVDTSGNAFKLCLAGIFLLVAVYLLIARKKDIGVRYVAAACVILIAVTAATSQLLNSGNTKISVLDVGNGSAVLVTKGGKSLLLGCGGGRGSEDRIINALSLSCKNELDVMVVPGENETESWAVVPVLRNVTVKEVIATEFSVNKDIVSAYSNLDITDRASITLWEGMTCEYFRSENNCCAYLDAQGTTALIVFNPACRGEDLPREWLSADILICREEVPKSIDPGGFKLLAVSSDKFDLNGQGFENFAVTAGTGSIVINSAGNSVFNFSKK